MYEISSKHLPDDKNSSIEQEHTLTLELNGYNGPLDLLLTLAQSKKLDITKISIYSLVDQYLQFIKKVKKINLDLASDYLVMAAVLAYIKSKLLIPDYNAKDKDETNLPEILEFNLKRLNSMRKNAEILFNRELLFDKRFLRGQIQDKLIYLEKEYYCSTKNLIICFSNIFNRKSTAPITIKPGTYYSVESALKKIRELYNLFTEWSKLQGFLPNLEEIGKDQYSYRMAFISTIAASLELAKVGELSIKQNKEFGDIYLKKRNINEQ